MSVTLLKLYHGMPAPARSVAATLRGSYLRWWRYGPESERLVAATLAREHWKPDRWKAWQEERLGRILHRAATQVPFYIRQWEDRRRRGDQAGWEYLENWPILEKESVRAGTRAFVAQDCDTRRMFHEHTSGTSGKSLDLWWSRTTVQIWYALFEARCRRWYWVSRHDRWAILGGQVVTPVAQRRPPLWVWNGALNQLYMSSYHLSPDLIPHYLDALKRYRVKYLWGYTSALNTLAQEAIRLGRRDVTMAVAITNAEPLFPYQREAISEAFQCPVRENYGMAEIVTAATECAEGNLHLWPEVGIVEVMAGEQQAPRGTSGELVCTGLLNKDMPLIRYHIGDRGTLPESDALCKCGRTLPLLTSVEGRSDDVLYTPDGRRVGRLDPIFKERLPVVEAQIIQEALDWIRVLYVPAPGFTQATARSIAERLRERMGSVQVTLEKVEQIPREHNGKFRAVICNIEKEHKGA